MDVDAILDKLAPVYDHYVWPTTHEECMAQGSKRIRQSSASARLGHKDAQSIRASLVLES